VAGKLSSISIIVAGCVSPTLLKSNLPYRDMMAHGVDNLSGTGTCLSLGARAPTILQRLSSLRLCASEVRIQRPSVELIIGIVIKKGVTYPGSLPPRAAIKSKTRIIVSSRAPNPIGTNYHSLHPFALEAFPNRHLSAHCNCLLLTVTGSGCSLQQDYLIRNSRLNLAGKPNPDPKLLLSFSLTLSRLID
jgi:hypothetical protein